MTFNSEVPDIYTMNDDNHKVTKMVLDLGATLAHKADSTATHKVSFSGDIAATILVNHSTLSNGSEVEDVNPQSMVMSGGFTVDNDSFDATFEVNMTNAATFTSLPPKYLEGETYADFGSYAFSNNDNTLTINWPQRTVSFTYDASDMSITKKVVYSDGYVEENVLSEYQYDSTTGQYTEVSKSFESLDDFIANNNNLNGTNEWFRYGENLSFVAVAPTTWSKDGGNISATIMTVWDYPDEDADNWRDIDGRLTMAVDFDGYQPATIEAVIDRSGYVAGTGSLTMKYSDVTIVVSGSADVADEDDPQLSGNVVITTASGSLEIYPDVTIGGLRGSVKVGGEVVGRIKPSDIEGQLIVTYVNGDFETVVF